MKLYLHFINTSSWHGVYLSNKCIFMVWYLVEHRDNFTLLHFTLQPFKCFSL